MKKSCQIVVSALVALVAANLFKCLLAATATVTMTYGDWNSTPVSSSVPVTNALYPVSATITDGSDDYMTISITNMYGTQLFLSFAYDAGSPRGRKSTGHHTSPHIAYPVHFPNWVGWED